MKKIFIANRGEIAVRVIRTCQNMGIKSVLGCSTIDAESYAARIADEVVIIGSAESSQSYLNIDSVIHAAKGSKSDAVHPGYGFLSERPEFVEACEKEGLVFIGPSADSMRKLGNKVLAKQLAEKAEVPLVPGYYKTGATDEELATQAMRIGFPILAKASAGGGGRGMRAIYDPTTFLEMITLARDEAMRSFGDDEMMLEKLVGRPRHIEVQILADSGGNVIVLYERECSLQRRRQKVLEEAGAAMPGFGERIWPAMRDAAIKIIKAAKYVGAGTVEFLVDDESGEFYFLEVNARLQVEHPVTEAITGLDLVYHQIEIARGNKLELPKLITNGNRDGIFGHSIEVRIIAEDPAQNFLPSVGKILAFVPPHGPGIRVDTGFQTSDTVPSNYDSLLAKLIVFAESRALAIAKLKRALLNFHIIGVKTNINYILDVIQTQEFATGDFHVNWLEEKFEGWHPSTKFPDGIGELIASSTSTPHVSPNKEESSSNMISGWNTFVNFKN